MSSPSPDEPSACAIRESTGAHAILGNLTGHVAVHGDWSVFTTFQPNTRGMIAGIAGLSQGNMVCVTAARALTSPAQLLSFLMDSSSVGARFAVVAMPPSMSLRVVQLMGKGARLLLSLDTAGGELSAAVRSEHDKFLSGLAAMKSGTMKKRCQMRTGKRKKEGMGSITDAPGDSPGCVTPPRSSRRCSRTLGTSPLLAPLPSSSTTVHLATAAVVTSIDEVVSPPSSIDALRAKITELTAQALSQGVVITACPIQARQGRVTLDVRSYSMTCIACKLPGVWDEDHQDCLVGCMECAEVRHAKCIAPVDPVEWRCEDCHQASLQSSLHTPFLYG